MSERPDPPSAGRDPQINIEGKEGPDRRAFERYMRNMEWLNQRTPDELKTWEGKTIVVWLDGSGKHKWQLFSNRKEAGTFHREMPESDRIGANVHLFGNLPSIPTVGL